MSPPQIKRLFCGVSTVFFRHGNLAISIFSSNYSDQKGFVVTSPLLFRQGNAWPNSSSTSYQVKCGCGIVLYQKMCQNGSNAGRPFLACPKQRDVSHQFRCKCEWPKQGHILGQSSWQWHPFLACCIQQYRSSCLFFSMWFDLCVELAIRRWGGKQGINRCVGRLIT